MAEQGSRTLDREILNELRSATTKMAQGLTDLTSLQQTQTTANQDFQTSLDAINNSLYWITTPGMPAPPAIRDRNG